MKPRIAKDMPQHVRPKREGMDAQHLANVRQLPCAVCGTIGLMPREAHHLLRTEERGLSRKSSDRWAIPLCVSCHHSLHMDGDEERYLAGWGIDGRAVAKSLWAARGDLDAMERVIFNVRQRAALKVRGRH